MYEYFASLLIQHTHSSLTVFTVFSNENRMQVQFQVNRKSINKLLEQHSQTFILIQSHKQLLLMIRCKKHRPSNDFHPLLLGSNFFADKECLWMYFSCINVKESSALSSFRMKRSGNYIDSPTSLLFLCVCKWCLAFNLLSTFKPFSLYHLPC